VPQIIASITLYIAFFFVLLALLHEIRLGLLSLRAKNWTQTEGSIEKWDISTGSEGEDGQVYVKNMEYKYSVGEVVHCSKRIGFGFPYEITFFFAHGALNEVLAFAPAVTPYYNPKNPAESTLVTGFRLYHLMRLWTVLFVLLFISMLAWA